MNFGWSARVFWGDGVRFVYGWRVVVGGGGEILLKNP
jgi:hypothetical protein